MLGIAAHARAPISMLTGREMRRVEPMVEVAALPGVTSSHRSNRPHRTEVRRSTPSCNVSKRVLVSSLSP